MNNEQYGFGTKAIHAGNVKDTQYGALTTPIPNTSLRRKPTSSSAWACR